MHARFHAPALVEGASTVELPPDEAEHLSRVLRLRVGAEVRLFDGRGREFEGRVASMARARVSVAVTGEVRPPGAEPAVRLVLAQAVLKGDAMDQVVRDAAMLGVSRIVPMVTAHGEVPLRRLQGAGRVPRWQRIAVASVKQCGRAVVPVVEEPRPLAEVLARLQEDARFILAEPAGAAGEAGEGLSWELPVPGSAVLLVGPEGGWASEEVAAALAAGCRPLTLGPRTLRADAAAVVGITALQCVWREFSRNA
jgi:16S rRNA (uracil1498-N3)-methyltransferase